MTGQMKANIAHLVWIVVLYSVSVYFFGWTVLIALVLATARISWIEDGRWIR